MVLVYVEEYDGTWSAGFGHSRCRYVGVRWGRDWAARIGEERLDTCASFFFLLNPGDYDNKGL